MMIKHLHVKNFRSLAHSTIQFEPLTVLVGPNGSGKSNLVDVLHFVADAFHQGLNIAVNRRGGIEKLRFADVKSNESQDIEIELTIEDGSMQAEYAFGLGSERPGEFRVKYERCNISLLSETPRTVGFEIRERQWVRTPASLMLTNIPGSEQSLVLPFIASGPYQALVDNLGRMSFYQVVIEHLAEPQKIELPYPLVEDGSNLASFLFELQRMHPDQYERLEIALRLSTPDIAHLHVEQVGGYLVISLSHRVDDRDMVRFELFQESLGTRQLLTLLAALYQYPSRTVIGIEEPETHVHIGSLATLWEEFEDAAAHSQLILTTHSPDLLDLAKAEQIRVVEKINGKTVVGSLEAPQVRMIQKRLVTPGQLWQTEGLFPELIS